ncbi:tyrosine-type recombinase/integrase, partial [Enterocloster clostridioformis]
MKTTDFAMLVNQFIMEYLVAARDLSPNTVLSYRDSIVLLITFMSNVHGKRPEALEIADITAERVEEFLGWLESERTNSPSTRNIRLAAIHSLFRYLCSQRPEHIFHSQQILSIPVKKTAQTEVTYLDTAQTEKLLAAPDATTAKGKRDLALLCLLYDSGCRVQELADVRMSDIRFTVPPQVTLTGKGRKTRTVPLMKETAAILRNYIDCY